MKISNNIYEANKLLTESFIELMDKLGEQDTQVFDLLPKGHIAPTQCTISRKEMEDKFDAWNNENRIKTQTNDIFRIMKEYPSDLIFHEIVRLNKEICRLRGWKND